MVQAWSDLDDHALSHRCEHAIRNYDPCISCATHFLDLTRGAVMSVADAAPTAVVAGLGRPDRGDDGVGAEVVRLLSTEDLPGVSVQVLEDPTALIDTWAAVPVAVVVDAVVSGRPPGTVITRDVGARAEPLSSRAWGADASRGGSHALGVATAVELSRALGRLPDRVVLVGVEAGSVDFGCWL